MLSNSQAQFFTVSSVALKAGQDGQIHNDHMGEAFASLVKLPEDAVIFTGDKVKIPVNKALLSVFSPSLRKLFEDVPCCVSPTIFLPDCNSSSIYHLLSLISTGVTSNDKVVPKDVLNVAKLVSIDLKNIVRGTLGNKVNREIIQEETFIEQPLAQNNNKRKSHISDTDQNSKKLRLKFNFPSKKDVLQQEEAFSSSHRSSSQQPSRQYNSNLQQYPIPNQIGSSQSKIGSSQQLSPPTYASPKQFPSQSQFGTVQQLGIPNQYLPQNQSGSSQKIVTPQQFATQNQLGPSQQFVTTQQYPSLNQQYPSQIPLSSPQVITPQQYLPQNQLGPVQQLGHVEPQPHQQNQALHKPLQLPSILPQNLQNPVPQVQLPHIPSQPPTTLPPQKPNEPISVLTKETIQPPQSIPPVALTEVIDSDTFKIFYPPKKATEPKRKRAGVSKKNAQPEIVELEDTETEVSVPQAEPAKIIESPFDITKECQICHEKETKLSLLWRHYYVKHFYKELKAKFESKIVDNNCPTCGAKFPAIQAVLLHLGRNHSEINHLLKSQNLKEIPNNKQESVTHQQKPDSVPETTTIPLTTPVSSIKKEPINCQICSEGNFISISALWSHYCLGHYYSDLKSKFGHLLKDLTCVICDKSFDRPMKSILHLGTTHRKLNSILKENGLTELLTPKEYAQKNKDSSLTSTTSSIPPSTTSSTLQSCETSSPPSIPTSAPSSSPQPSSSSSLPPPKEANIEGVKSEPISCLMCKQNNFRNYDDLWTHYSISHFYQELKAQFGQFLKGKTCTSCNLKFGERKEAAQHIGKKHQQVNVLLKAKGLDELPLPTVHQYESTPTSYYLVDLEDDKISLQTREPKQNSLVDLETNEVIDESGTGDSNEAFTEEQIELLTEEFKEDQELPAERKNALALALELTEDQVENWFKRRRENGTNDAVNEEQESILREEFNEDQHLSKERRNTLALALELTEDQVDKWFQKNRNENVTNKTPVRPIEAVEEPVEPIPHTKEEFLKLEFENNPDLSDERIVELSLALGLKENQVRKWFHGKR